MVLIPVFASTCIIMAIIIRLKKRKIFNKKPISENGMQNEEMKKESNIEEGKNNLDSQETSRSSSPIPEAKQLENSSRLQVCVSKKSRRYMSSIKI